MTIATRLRPGEAGTPAQIVAKLAEVRGGRPDPSGETWWRHPSTDPSAGTTVAAPRVENVQDDPSRWKYPQYR